MSEPKIDVVPPAGARITVTVPSLIWFLSGIVQVSFEPSAAVFVRAGRGGDASGAVCDFAWSGSVNRQTHAKTHLKFRTHLIPSPPITNIKI
jgi:hypothetical protein